MHNTIFTITPQQALEKLQVGNAAYVAGKYNALGAIANARSQVQDKQKPFAIVLSCSDSRVPPELIFNQGLGDIFVIRVAGNIVMPSQLASVEFAVSQFNVPLILVLGHSNCGAIAATIDLALQSKNNTKEIHNPIFKAIAPVVLPLVHNNKNDTPKTLHAKATLANIEQSVQQLYCSSSLLTKRIKHGNLVIYGGEYSLHTGVVKFLPQQSRLTA